MVTLFLPFGERTASCRGSLVRGLLALRRRFGKRWSLSPEQSLTLHGGNWTAVLSPFVSSGRLGMYQPLMTSWRNPLASSRSLRTPASCPAPGWPQRHWRPAGHAGSPETQPAFPSGTP